MISDVIAPELPPRAAAVAWLGHLAPHGPKEGGSILHPKEGV